LLNSVAVLTGAGLSRGANVSPGNAMPVGSLRNIDPEDEAQLLATIDRWVEREVRPIVRTYDHADRYPMETVEQMKELGLFGATISPEYGGLGLPARTYAKIVMRISRDW